MNNILADGKPNLDVIHKIINHLESLYNQIMTFLPDEYLEDIEQIPDDDFFMESFEKTAEKYFHHLTQDEKNKVDALMDKLKVHSTTFIQMIQQLPPDARKKYRSLANNTNRFI